MLPRFVEVRNGVFAVNQQGDEVRLCECVRGLEAVKDLLPPSFCHQSWHSSLEARFRQQRPEPSLTIDLAAFTAALQIDLGGYQRLPPISPLIQSWPRLSFPSHTFSSFGSSRCITVQPLCFSQ